MSMEVLLAVAAGFFFTSFVLQRGLIAYDSWNEAVRLERRDAWMRMQCQNETFFANMRVHSDVCEVVQRNASRTPMIHSLSAAMHAEVSWWPVVVGIALVALQYAAKFRKLYRTKQQHYISIA
jgi:hypothetical protein